MSDLTDKLLATLPPGRAGLFNPWADSCPHQAPGSDAAQRMQRLRQHLDGEVRLILVGEAPGYQGCRYSGVAFTSERLLLEGAIPRIPAPAGRLSSRRLPFSEPSATTVWRALKTLGIEDCAILWNAVPLHPHHPGVPWSNRRPTLEELRLGTPALRILRAAWPRATFVPVGRTAQAALQHARIAAASCVRHPAHGGALKFCQDLNARCLMPSDANMR
ncbi:hypothetical protein GCM10027034_45530 [Ramlibacter solisilvae]|uniref:Uracil-DNA glycosylase-like domain-containing protein n=1 Tax=Ramlibacter tataouinensis TaxID=94132 RepID=A0A127JSS4_9BURK|nr:uracil-DNA glycosylase [Ramlibacter tataouinensis]AMO23017.1 hypothetical protein UC35_09115 [Ramlibacter tataouinensis]